MNFDCSAGGSQLLPKLIGIPKAKELIFTGRIINGEEAESIGLINELSDKPFERVLEIADEISKGGPLGLTAAKTLINSSSDLSL